MAISPRFSAEFLKWETDAGLIKGLLRGDPDPRYVIKYLRDCVDTGNLLLHEVCTFTGRSGEIYTNRWTTSILYFKEVLGYFLARQSRSFFYSVRKHFEAIQATFQEMAVVLWDKCSKTAGELGSLVRSVRQVIVDVATVIVQDWGKFCAFLKDLIAVCVNLLAISQKILA